MNTNTTLNTDTRAMLPMYRYTTYLTVTLMFTLTTIVIAVA